MTLLTKEAVCKDLGISPRCLEMMVARDEFPPPVRIGKRNYWSGEAVEHWRSRLFRAQEQWSPALA